MPSASSPVRVLTDHVVNPANDRLKIEVVDEPGHGGACHSYVICGFNTETNAAADGVPRNAAWILFQNGPIAEVGVNGVTHEALLSILCDRMRGFQSGPYASDDNAEALACMEQAQTALQRRTKARMARGVEGTHTA